LMICNDKQPMCIAGVFGGADSGVSNNTTSVFIESAYFNPLHIRRSSKNHSLKTDASFRFERGTDPDMTLKALTRACNLILEIAGGTLSMGPLDVYPTKLEPHRVAFSNTNCNALIGKEIDMNIVKNIITNLGIEIESEGSDGLLLQVPRYKADVTREADVIEEVMRIYGYNNVEISKSITYTAFNDPKNMDVVLENKAAGILEGFGFNEIMSLSLTKEQYYPENNNLVKVVNPLSNDLNVLRGDMLYSGLEAIAYNVNRKSQDLKLFEMGRIYSMNHEAEFKYTEQKQLALFVTGNLYPENHYKLDLKGDLTFLKAALLNLFEKCGVSNIKSSESDYSPFEYGLSYTLNNKSIAQIGSVNKNELKKFDIAQPVFYAVINWNVLVKSFSKNKIEFEEISKFPSVRRDLALLIDKSVKYNEIEELAFNTEKKLLKEVNLFDVYEGEKLGNKKSYAVSFTLLDKEATLTDKQIDTVMDKLITNYKEKLGAELR
ncbi:MAG: phenylalanine--tRNA ligase subunit beta, partial [Bacteroidetes bacterium]|nr:phenylalanine--tRNA ligase subunit beta [Bacteroidota bacterium]